MRLIVENGVYYIIENPDMVVVGKGPGTKEGDLGHLGKGKAVADWTDSDAHPFGMINNKWVIGKSSATHNAITSQGRTGMKYPGRFWRKKKIISFWLYPPFGKLKKTLDDLDKAWMRDGGNSLNFSNWKMDIPRSDKIDLDMDGTKASMLFRNVVAFDSKQSEYVYAHTRLYNVKTVLSDKPLKGLGKPWKEKRTGINIDKGQQHVAPAMLKKGKIAKMSKKQKKALHKYFADKGRLSKEEERMYKMIQKENVEVFFDGEKFIFGEAVDAPLKKRMEKFDKKQVEMGINAEREHDTDDELDVVKNETDLLKITLAHLEEDPQYYTKLKKMEESVTKYFTLEEGSGILTEANPPRLSNVAEMIVQYFRDKPPTWKEKTLRDIAGITIHYKHGNEQLFKGKVKEKLMRDALDELVRHGFGKKIRSMAGKHLHGGDPLGTDAFAFQGNKKLVGLVNNKLTEAPHIEVGKQVIDLEFESGKVEGLKKIIRAIMGEELTDKYGSSFKLSSASEVSEFVKKIMKNPQVRKIIK